MKEVEIIDKIKVAINVLFSNDAWLLHNDLSEKSITHKLAEYLQPLFLDYNVDCEYNGNVDRVSGRKRIGVLKSDLEEKGLLKESEIIGADDEIADRLVYPDIIIHKRGTNEQNLCIIEVKKSTSKIPFDYDVLKLNAYTNSYYGNDLKYKIGLFVEFVTGTEELTYYVKYFQNGRETDKYKY